MLRHQGLIAVAPYLEQSLSPYVEDALRAFASDGRPRHPCLSQKQSALMYIALFLKARNRATSEKTRLLWQNKLELFVRDASHARYIQANAVRGSPKNVVRSGATQRSATAEPDVASMHKHMVHSFACCPVCSTGSLASYALLHVDRVRPPYRTTRESGFYSLAFHVCRKPKRSVTKAQR